MKAKPKPKSSARRKAVRPKAPVRRAAEPSPPSLRDRFATRIAPELARYPLFPLLVLFGLNLVDEFDIQASLILGPEIKEAFGLSNAGLAGVRTAAALAGLLIPVIGVLGDRSNRVRMAWLGAAVWGVFAFSTGLVPGSMVALLVFVRFGSGTAKLVNGPIHTTLLADYYPPAVRGRVYAFHRSGDAFAAILGPALAGLVAWQLGWRYAFFLLAIPTFLLIFLTVRMQEPVRGITEDREAALGAAKEEAVPFGQAVRWLYSIPTMKRLFFGAFCAGLGGIAYAVFSSVFLDEVFGVNELGRGVIASSGAPAALVAFWLGGRVTDKLIRTKTMAHVTAFFGFSVVGLGVVLALYAMAPALWVAVVITSAIGFFLALWVAPYLTITGLVSPPRIRSLGLSYAGFFTTLGIVGTLPIGAIADGPGVRWALFVAALVLAVGGLVFASAAKFANADVSRALQVLGTEAQLRLQRTTQATRSLLKVQGVDVAYDDTQVLFGVDFDVQEGELVALLGTNGAGKSTLLKAISGLVHPRAGAVYFDGRDITHLEPHESAALGIILMPGGKSIFPTLTVRENLDMAAWLYDRDKEYVDEAKARVFEIFPVLAQRGEQQAGSLSGGEQQMLSLAQAFIAKPKLLMIDELSLGLAPLIVQQLLRIVEEIHKNGTTVVLVEQSVNVALTVAKHAYFMEKGEIRFNGSTTELLRRRDILRSVFLEGAGTVVGGNGRRQAAKSARASRKRSKQDDVILSVRDVSVSFGGIVAVSDVGFDVYRGQILGLIGPNGAGKTTLFDVICGFIAPDTGHIRLEDRDISDLAPAERSRAGLGRSFQDAKLFSSLTVGETLACALERKIRAQDPISSATGMPWALSTERLITNRVEELIDLLGLGAFRDKFVSDLSTGSRRIVDLACVLAHEPSVLLLDEPSSGIAQRETEALGPLLHRVKEATGCTMLLVEHDMPLVTSVADELIALETGRVIARGAPKDVTNDPAVVEAYLGTDNRIVARSGARGRRSRTRRR
ncbi:MAG TPA: MFS transporter [Actinomycetota bacterium]|nr:MFS transporter [Actinomycetota bacterium]